MNFDWYRWNDEDYEIYLQTLDILAFKHKRCKFFLALLPFFELKKYMS